MYTVLENIRNTRIRFGYSQERMAEEINVGRTTYVHFENGDTALNFTYIERMAKVLGIPGNDILEGRHLGVLEDSGAGYGKEGPQSEKLSRIIDQNNELSRKLDILISRK